MAIKRRLNQNKYIKNHQNKKSAREQDQIRKNSFDGAPARRTIDAIVLHYAPFRGKNGETFEESLKIINREHGKFARDPDYPQKPAFYEWSDRKSYYPNISYHYVISKSGEVENTRDVGIVGYHAGHSTVNLRSLGICLIGNPPTERQISVLAEYINQIRKNIGNHPLYTHNEVRRYGGTECPGVGLTSLVHRYRHNEQSESRLKYKLR